MHLKSTLGLFSALKCIIRFEELARHRMGGAGHVFDKTQQAQSQQTPGNMAAAGLRFTGIAERQSMPGALRMASWKSRTITVSARSGRLRSRKR